MIGTLDTERREATVIGAGIAGLLAAYALDKKGYRVTLLEERAHAGGLIGTRRTEYGIAERAAHSLLATPSVVGFCRELGVELNEIRREARARFVLRDGRLRKFPLRAGEALSAICHAAFVRAGNHSDALNLETWGRRHLGDAAHAYLLTPFVRGIYGAQPAELGVAAAFPELAIAPGQTLLTALLGKAFKRRAQNGHSGHGARDATDTGKTTKQRKRMVAPLRGMGALTQSLERQLEQRLGARFQRGVRVNGLPDVPNVVLATPAYAAAALLQAEAPELSRRLREVRYTSLVSVTAFVERASFTRPVEGVGVLVPAREERHCLGILFNSSAFAGRVFDETRHASFTVLLGGSAQPDWVAATDESIAAAVRIELAELLGIQGEPLQLVINRWPRAIPQYSTALPDIWRSAQETWCGEPGHVLFGNYTGQVSLRGMIEQATAPW
ncbi:MAG: protoporphyrinogen oxidase [Acidobacteria bacterium]|nr:MAG: protoporphyrinogen oxidase [Acidobacteriota bacterium]